MTVKEKTQEIKEWVNEISTSGNHRFGEIQQLRGEGHARQFSKPFSRRINGKGEYAFHNGGRFEFQFNFGEENHNGIKGFRYGIALSLESGQDLPNPILSFQEKKRRFNEFFTKDKFFFNGLLMWVWHKYGNTEHREIFSAPKLIDENIYKKGNFIFIGLLEKRNILSVSKTDVNKIVELFDRLMPLYEYTEGFARERVENKIARICWNTNGWVKPSGWQGKSKSDSHEKKYGFGHEEWLFDFDKIIDGYHYGFLEPVRKGWNKYKGKVLDIRLWTVNSEEKQEYWIGMLKNVEVLESAEAKRAIAIYKQNGWYDSMQNDLKAVGADWTSLAKTNLKEIDLLNVRFKISARETIYDDLIPVDKSREALQSKRYSLLKDAQEGVESDNTDNLENGFNFNSGSASSGTNKTTAKKTYEKKEVELKLNHSKLQSSFLKYLQKQYPQNIVRRECKAHGQNKVDIVMKTESGHIFYEIKTYNSLLTSLRVAFGQLFEYCFYPDKLNAEKLYLVSDISPDSKFRKYIANVNKQIKIPFGYIHFNLEKGEIVETIER